MVGAVNKILLKIYFYYLSFASAYLTRVVTSCIIKIENLNFDLLVLH